MLFWSRILMPLYLLIFIHSCTDENNELDPPNVIIIFTDDQGYHDLGCYGATDIHTPNIDQMAVEGVKFTNFYAAQAVCSASRAALLTGCYPNRIGIHGAFMPNSAKGLHPDEITMAEMLKDIGYTNGIFGKWHLGDHHSFMPLKQGFDRFFGIPFSNDMWPYHPQQGPVFNFGPLPLYENETIIDTLEDQTNLTTEITNRSVAFIKENKDHPFFLYVAHPQPHVPLFVSNKFKGKSRRGLYGDVIMEIDWSVGQILKTLKEHQLDDNTIVIYTSDNGPWLSYGNHAGSSFPLREGKGTALEGGQREPCIVRYPAKLEGGSVISTPLMTIDLLPTIAHITGAKLPSNHIDGKNAWDVWTGVSDQSPQEAYYFYYKTNELHGIRYDHWKLYFPHSYRTLKGRTGGSGGLPVDYEMDTIQAIELYNLELDISETTNVADKYPLIVEKIKNLAEKARYSMGDALLNKEGIANRAAGTIQIQSSE